jgi:transposase-like protein
VLEKERSQTERTKMRKNLATIKESFGCKDCGKDFPYYVLDFDHVIGTKVHDLSFMCRWYTMEEINEEVKKCEIVCANCHRKRTHERKYVNKVEMDSNDQS